MRASRLLNGFGERDNAAIDEFKRKNQEPTSWRASLGLWCQTLRPLQATHSWFSCFRLGSCLALFNNEVSTELRVKKRAGFH